MAISLKEFEFDLKKKQLKITSEKAFNKTGKKGFPQCLFVMSHLTGIEVEFRPIRESHPLFDEDQWDGEQMIYEPVQANLCPNVKTLVVYNS
jgi:hypothetical protein